MALYDAQLVTPVPGTTTRKECETRSDAAMFSPGFASFLDFSRWLAAFFVFAGHLRNPIFIGYPDVPEEQRTPLISALYFISGFGTSSVIVFFVLSGFLIGGMGMAKLEKGAFRPAYYAIDRVTRLFIVYLPALVLTYLLDSLGNRYFGESGLWNCGHALMCKNFSDFTALLSLDNFLTNSLMLQSFFGPYFGSDKPLWSLSYEFWFYVTFGLFAASLLRRGGGRYAAVVLIFSICAVLGFHFVVLLGIWLIGAGVSLYRGHALRRPFVSVICFAVSCVAMRLFKGNLESASGLDYVLIFLNALCCAWVMISVRHLPLRQFAVSQRVNKFLAGFSYTLYLLHFPLMLFVIGAAAHVFHIADLRNGYLPNSTVGIALYAGTLVLVLAIAWAIAQATERHTDDARAILKGLLRQR